jgi:Ca2+:H+ antiporter
VAVLALAATWAAEPGPLGLVAVGLLLAGSVLAAVHHAEVIAHRVGEPFGSLALAVTVIEVTLIVTLMTLASWVRCGGAPLQSTPRGG